MNVWKGLIDVLRFVPTLLDHTLVAVLLGYH